MRTLDLILAAGPILLLIHWMTRKTPMPSARALPLAALVAYGIRLARFGTEANLVNASVVAGLLVALTPVLILWGAILFSSPWSTAGRWKRSATGSIIFHLPCPDRERAADVPARLGG